MLQDYPAEMFGDRRGTYSEEMDLGSGQEGAGDRENRLTTNPRSIQFHSRVGFRERGNWSNYERERRRRQWRNEKRMKGERRLTWESRPFKRMI